MQSSMPSACACAKRRSPASVSSRLCMRSFEYAPASGLEQAMTLLGEGDGLVRPLAGGTDLLPLMKADVAHPRRLVDLKRLPELSTGIQETTVGVSIGALTTLSALASSR